MKQLCFIAVLMFMSSVLHAREDGLQSVADELAAGLSRKGPVKVAVLTIPHHDNRTSDGPLWVCERLTTLLSKEKNITVIERNHLTHVFDENNLSETGRLDPDVTKLMGQVLGA